jgi:hypothetical protein
LPGKDFDSDLSLKPPQRNSVWKASFRKILRKKKAGSQIRLKRPTRMDMQRSRGHLMNRMQLLSLRKSDREETVEIPSLAKL